MAMENGWSKADTSGGRGMERVFMMTAAAVAAMVPPCGALLVDLQVCFGHHIVNMNLRIN